jgi:hypothetical protein
MSGTDTLVFDEDGTEYRVRAEAPPGPGLEQYTVLVRDESDRGEKVVGSFGFKRCELRIDPSSLVAHAFDEAEDALIERLALRFLAKTD